VQYPSVRMPSSRCLWQCGRRSADADCGYCEMAKAAAAKADFLGITVTCEKCQRSGCLKCVEKLSTELSRWLSSPVGIKYGIASSSYKEEDMWRDILELNWHRVTTGRTWRWSPDGHTLIFSVCPLDVEIRAPKRRAPALQVRARTLTLSVSEVDSTMQGAVLPSAPDLVIWDRKCGPLCCCTGSAAISA
jgi:hypothetical protein